MYVVLLIKPFLLLQKTRAVMIICSSQPPTPVSPLVWSFFSKKVLPSIMPLTQANLSESDRQVLSDLDMPQGKWDNLSALLALYDQTKLYDVFSVWVSKPGMELSHSYILEQIEFLLRHSTKKTAGG